jgi:hypothetical protein
MKKLIVIFSICSFLVSRSQITLDFAYPKAGGPSIQNSKFFIDKFHVSGYKYVQINYIAKTIQLYNLNHTLYKTINIPGFAGLSAGVMFITENLFDLDPGVEYIAADYTPNNKLWIIDESGAQLFFRDSGQVSNAAWHSMENSTGIFTDGVSTKMMLSVVTGSTASVYKHEIYNLPGSIPCGACTSGTLSGISVNPNDPIDDPKIFPNPATDQLRLKYKLPEGSHLAEMKIYDTTGKVVDEFKVTDTFDFIYLPTNYNNGLYLYSLIVDGKVVKTEKIVLNK